MGFLPAKPDVFSAISDETRRALLLRLAREGEKNVSELLEPLSISQPAVSKHLRCLREAGLVRRRTVGRMNLYQIDAQRLRQVYDWVAHFERYWDQKLDALGDYLDKRKRNQPSTG
ncbi:MAG: metalloregulator ArsR/SmtB family transcription factor [Verrucomicrobiota bacterium]